MAGGERAPPSLPTRLRQVWEARDPPAELGSHLVVQHTGRARLFAAGDNAGSGCRPMAVQPVCGGWWCRHWVQPEQLQSVCGGE
jgi:hypothetical protein